MVGELEVRAFAGYLKLPWAVAPWKYGIERLQAELLLTLDSRKADIEALKVLVPYNCTQLLVAALLKSEATLRTQQKSAQYTVKTLVSLLTDEAVSEGKDELDDMVKMAQRIFDHPEELDLRVQAAGEALRPGQSPSRS